MKPPDHFRARAFTLVEVVLAILIISAIMTVLLYFYHRSVEVRQVVLDRAEFLAVSRMFMDQVTGELRTARVVEDQFVGFEGTSNSISFVCTTVPQSPRWIANSNDSVVLPPMTDLKKVTYRILTGTNALDIRGVDRIEELLTTAAFTASTNATEFVSAAETAALSETEANLVSTNEFQLIRPPLSDRIKLLQFRYWAGTNWIDSWSRLELPAGVEIILSEDPMPAESSTVTSSASPGDEYPLEIFRRVVYLPNSIPPANRILDEESSEFPF